MIFTHKDLFDDQYWFISLEEGRYAYHNDDIDKFLQNYSDWTYKEIALKFGAYICDDSGEDEYFFEDESDCIRCKNFLNDLIR